MATVSGVTEVKVEVAVATVGTAAGAVGATVGAMAGAGVAAGAGVGAKTGGGAGTAIGSCSTGTSTAASPLNHVEGAKTERVGAIWAGDSAGFWGAEGSMGEAELSAAGFFLKKLNIREVFTIRSIL